MQQSITMAPLTHSLRRRRSWGSPDAADIKRRRVQEPAPRGIDRYVPERSKNDRMDLDPPIHSVNDTSPCISYALHC